MIPEFGNGIRCPAYGGLDKMLDIRYKIRGRGLKVEGGRQNSSKLKAQSSKIMVHGIGYSA